MFLFYSFYLVLEIEPRSCLCQAHSLTLASPPSNVPHPLSNSVCMLLVLSYAPVFSRGTFFIQCSNPTQFIWKDHVRELSQGETSSVSFLSLPSAHVENTHLLIYVYAGPLTFFPSGCPLPCWGKLEALSFYLSLMVYSSLNTLDIQSSNACCRWMPATFDSFYCLVQWFSTILLLWPVSTVPHVAVTPNHKIIIIVTPEL